MFLYALISVLDAHDSDIKKMAISAYKNETPVLITCSRDGHVKGWSICNIAQPKLEFDFTPHTGFVNSLTAPANTSNKWANCRFVV